MRTIDAGRPVAEPPTWAVLERHLLDLHGEAVEAVLEAYVREDGRIRWPADGGGYDDAFEGFSNRPLVYLLTGAERYREWVLEYVAAWAERTERNGGIVPDNAGPEGIGQYAGDWYGGYYGWTWPHGWPFLGESLIAAGENALLLTGDDGHRDPARSTMDALADAAVEREDTPFVPHKHGDPGALEFDPHDDRVLRDENGVFAREPSAGAPWEREE